MAYEFLQTAFIPDKPLVSVIIPAYNAEKFIAQTLLSVLNQTHSSIEVLVIDDGSFDRTPDIVRNLALEDDRIKLIQQPNLGVAAARNQGIKEARGEFIVPLDADDIWFPNAIEKAILKFRASSPSTGVIYVWTLDIDEYSKPTDGFQAAKITGNVLKTLICHYFLGNASATMIRKKCIDFIGGYDSNLKLNNAQGCEDWDLYLRLAEHYEFEVVPEFLVGYRKIFGTMSKDLNQMARSQQYILNAVNRRHPNFPSYLLSLSRSSFYLYLANQSDCVSSKILWFKEAIKAYPAIFLMRPLTILLVIKPILFRRTLKSIPALKSDSDFGRDLKSGISEINNLVYTPRKNKIKTFLKVLLGQALHQVISKV
ncbi:MAG: glycosyltransferase [Nodosilinea sp. WJT8-NPBG4]|jgi:glycosyltransferase involved in cell wall biosynthesis|nr:glycosyltransferase [Nodosilinea sp. WJT8-NPBG4]